MDTVHYTARVHTRHTAPAPIAPDPIGGGDSSGSTLSRFELRAEPCRIPYVYRPRFIPVKYIRFTGRASLPGNQATGKKEEGENEKQRGTGTCARVSVRVRYDGTVVVARINKGDGCFGNRVIAFLPACARRVYTLSTRNGWMNLER